MSERIQSQGTNAIYTAPGDFWSTGSVSALGLSDETITSQQMREICGSLTSTPPDFVTALGTYWVTASYGHTDYNHVGRPNETGQDCSLGGASGTGGDTFAGMLSARSWHAGGVNVLFCDGSVRLVGNHVDLAIWQAQATIAGAEIMGEE